MTWPLLKPKSLNLESNTPWHYATKCLKPINNICYSSAKQIQINFSRWVLLWMQQRCSRVCYKILTTASGHEILSHSKLKWFSVIFQTTFLSVLCFIKTVWWLTLLKKVCITSTRIYVPYSRWNKMLKTIICEVPHAFVAKR